MYYFTAETYSSDDVLFCFRRDRVCSLNDEVQLVPASDDTDGRRKAHRGQRVDCDSGPRGVGSEWKHQLHRSRQQERCLRRDQEQVPEWNRQDPTWVSGGETAASSRQMTEIDVCPEQWFWN